MKLKSIYTKEEINQVEHYVVRLHEFICSDEFQNKYPINIKEKFYEELRYARHFAQITRKIFLSTENEPYVAIQMDKLRAEKDGCIKAYKIPTKDLLFSIFNITKKTHFQQAQLYRANGSFKAVDGYGFVKLEKYLTTENPLITDAKDIIDFIALEYEKN